MADTDTSMYLDGHSYSLFDPEEIHRDMRLDPGRARIVLSRNPAIAEAHEFCEQCRRIELENQEAPAAQVPGSYADLDEAIVAHSERSTRFAITRANLARMLGLRRGERIGRMYVDQQCQQLHVVVVGEHYQPAPDGQPVPVSRMSRRPGRGAAAVVSPE